MTDNSSRIAIVGAGAWGTALANVAVRAGRTATLYARDPNAVEMMMRTGRNKLLPIDPKVEVTADITLISKADIILLAVPAQSLREAIGNLSPFVRARVPVIVCAKGIERGTGKFVTEIIAECAPHTRPGVLSGPSFAADVVCGLPTAVTLAMPNKRLAALLAKTLSSKMFRVYYSTDVRGVEIGGALKNVLAIAAGITEGRGYSASAVAALTTRGLAELIRFGEAYGAQRKTLIPEFNITRQHLRVSSNEQHICERRSALHSGARSASIYQSLNVPKSLSSGRKDGAYDASHGS